MSATAASAPVAAALPQGAPGKPTAAAAGSGFSAVLAQLALLSPVPPRPAAPAPGSIDQVRAPPQARPAAKTHHVVSTLAAQTTPAVAVTAHAATPPVATGAAPPPQPVADPDAGTDPSAASDDATGAPAAASGAGRHTTPAAPTPTPEAVPTVSDRVASAVQAGANAAAPPPQATAPQAGTATQDAIAQLTPAAAATPVATTPAASATTPPTTTAPPTPATQVAHAAAVHFTTGAEGQVTIHLQPAELGAVQVRIERLHDGTANVTVQVERAETLHVLQQDLPHLHQALDRAGVPAEARQVTVELAPSAAATNNAGAGTGQDGNRQNQGRAPRAEQQTALGGDQPDPENPTPRWRPAGLNITA